MRRGGDKENWLMWDNTTNNTLLNPYLPAFQSRNLYFQKFCNFCHLFLLSNFRSAVPVQDRVCRNRVLIRLAHELKDCPPQVLRPLPSSKKRVGHQRFKTNKKTSLLKCQKSRPPVNSKASIFLKKPKFILGLFIFWRPPPKKIDLRLQILISLPRHLRVEDNLTPKR